MRQTEVVRIIDNKKVVFVTIKGLAMLCGKSAHTLRKWEEKGWLPPANLRGEEIPNKHGGFQAGERLYSKKYALQIAEHVKQAVSGVPVPLSLKTVLYEIMRHEREEFIKTV